MESLKAGNVSGEKIILTLYCECKLERDNILLPDPSIRRNAQNKSKILILTKRTENGLVIDYIKLLNSKSRDVFCAFKANDIQQLYPQMIKMGKITIVPKIGDKEIKVFISNAPPELLQKVVEFVCPATTSKPIQPAKEEKKSELKKETIKSLDPRESMRLERKRKLQNLYNSNKFEDTIKPLDKRDKKDKDSLALYNPRITIMDLPYDIIGIIIAYNVRKDFFKLSLLNRTFHKVCDLTVYSLSLSNKFIPTTHFIGLLSRFSRLRNLSLAKLPAITTSALKSFPVELYQLSALDLTEMSNLCDGVLQRIMGKTKKLSTLKLPYFAQLTSDSLDFCVKFAHSFESFALTSDERQRDWKDSKIPPESVSIFFQRIKTTKDSERYYQSKGVTSIAGKGIALKEIELYYLNNNISESIANSCKEVESLKLHIVNPDGCLLSFKSLENLTKLSITGDSQNPDILHDNLMELLEYWEENRLKEFEIGEIATPPLIYFIAEKFNQSLKVMKIHSRRIRNPTVEEVCEKCRGLEHLDISGCLATEEVIPCIERLKLKRLVLEMEAYKLFSCRQGLFAKFPNTIVETK